MSEFFWKISIQQNFHFRWIFSNYRTFFIFFWPQNSKIFFLHFFQTKNKNSSQKTVIISHNNFQSLLIYMKTHPNNSRIFLRIWNHHQSIFTWTNDGRSSWRLFSKEEKVFFLCSILAQLFSIKFLLRFSFAYLKNFKEIFCKECMRTRPSFKLFTPLFVIWRQLINQFLLALIYLLVKVQSEIF